MWGGSASSGEPESDPLCSAELQPHSIAVKSAAIAVHRIATRAGGLDCASPAETFANGTDTPYWRTRAFDIR